MQTGWQGRVITRLQNLNFGFCARAFPLVLLPLGNIDSVPKIAATSMLHAGSREWVRYSLHAAKQRAA